MLKQGVFRTGLVVVLVVAALAAVFAACAGAEDSISTDRGVATGGEGEALFEQPASGDSDINALDAVPSVGGAAPEEGGNLPLPQLADRKIIRTATLELEVEDVGAAVQKVESAAITAGGFVSESTVFVQEPPEPEDGDEAPPERTQTATVTIRVPAEAYANVMSQLRGIASEVRSESSQASEVTEEFTDLQSRLRNLEATEGQYLKLLEQAETIPDILTVQDRINSVRLEIEQVQGRINLLDDLTDLATITATLVPPSAPIRGEDSGQGWAAEAWDAAWEGSQDALVALGTVAIIGGVVLVWLAVPALVALVGWRRFGWRLPAPRPQAKEEAGEGGTSI